MEVNVGQVLFVLNAKNHSLLPAQVDEVVVSRTIRGETTQHILVLQNGKKIALEKLQTPWFAELEAAKSYLLAEAEKMIDSVISEAQNAANTHFESSDVTAGPSKEDVSIDVLVKPPTGNLTVDLGDGRQATVTLPEEFTIENPSS